MERRAIQNSITAFIFVTPRIMVEYKVVNNLDESKQVLSPLLLDILNFIYQ